MTGVFRPRGGRPNKVTKSAPTARRPSRQQQQSLAIAADQAIHHPSLHDGDVGPPDNPDPGDEHHHHHHQHHHLHHHQDGVNDDGILSDSMGKSDAEMGDGSAHVDSLSAAANILTNGAGMLAAVAADDHSGVPAEYATLPPPQLDEQDFDGASRTTQEMARDSGYANVLVESALAKRLARQPALRHAHQRRPEQQLNLSRRSNVEALFAHVAGDELATSCKNCRKGHGPWTACVVVDGQMCGSCANCWFNASGARCSFHGKRSSIDILWLLLFGTEANGERQLQRLRQGRSLAFTPHNSTHSSRSSNHCRNIICLGSMRRAALRSLMPTHIPCPPPWL